MLVFWLLALGVGFANACLLHTDGAWHDPVQSRASFLALPSNGHGMPMQAVDPRPTAPVPDEAACLEFCAAEPTALAKQPVDPKAPQSPLHVWIHAHGAPSAASSLAPTRPADGVAALPHRPVSILFLRLTL